MEHSDLRTNTLIIGASQSGLAAAQQCIKKWIKYIIIDAQWSSGETRRNRYTSLELFTPDYLSELPWLRIKSSSKRIKKDEMANYLDAYEKKRNIWARFNTKAEQVTQENNETFITQTSSQEETTTITSSNIILATWAFSQAFIPKVASTLDKSIFQIHSSQYQYPQQLPEGRICVV